MRHTVSLNRNRDFQRLYRRGGSAVSGCMVMYCRPNRLPVTRLGLTVSSKLGGAVRRNRIRRRLKACYLNLEGGVRPGMDIVLVARARAHDAPFSVLTAQMRELIFKLRVGEP
ncbi:MAG: ribonuclease P protein component [Oscillospiraceae bacterium]|nr:ribonuclease P protein component [Oscillospiraceae bacterium]